MGYLSAMSDNLAKATDYKLHISGYANAHIMVHNGMPKLINPDKDLSKPLVQLREASLFIDGTLTDNLIFSTELDLSIDLGKQEYSGHSDRGEFLVNYYYLDYDIGGAFGWDADDYGKFSIRGGRILVPFNDYNENKASFEQYLMSQPYTAWQIVPVNNLPISFHQFGWTDVGVTFNWAHNVSTVGIIDLKLSVINGLGVEEGQVLDSNTVQLEAPSASNPTVRTRDGLFTNKSHWDEVEDNNSNKAIVLKISYKSAGMPLDFGASWYEGKWDEDDERNLQMYGVHLNYVETDWTLRGEWVRANVEQIAGTNPVTEPGPSAINISTGDYKMYAWYLESSFVPFRYGINNRRYLRFIVRYDEVDTNDKIFFNSFNRYRVTLGTEWEFINSVRLRYEWQQHTLSDFEKAPSPLREAGGEEHIYVNMLSIIAYF